MSIFQKLFGVHERHVWNPKYDSLTAYNTTNMLANCSTDPATRAKYAAQQTFSPEHVARMKQLQAEYDADLKAGRI